VALSGFQFCFAAIRTALQISPLSIFGIKFKCIAVAFDCLFYMAAESDGGEKFLLSLLWDSRKVFLE
jgi:hypothetical protein